MTQTALNTRHGSIFLAAVVFLRRIRETKKKKKKLPRNEYYGAKVFHGIDFSYSIKIIII